jgi:RNA polymerase sigma-70 factor, ECF subfamily
VTAVLTRRVPEPRSAERVSTVETEPVADAALLAAVADGDRAALAVLYRRHAPWLLARLSRRCADPGVVDEVLQDTFVGVWRGAGRFDGRGEVGAWVWGIAARRLVDAVRRAPRPTAELPADEADVVVSAEEQVLLGIEHGELGPALDRLSPELRAVVQATVLDGLTTREAGRLLGIPSGTVKTRMMRARAQLREDLA